MVFLHPERGDDVTAYELEPQWFVNPTTGLRDRILKHKPDGSCIYLGDNGCTIHDRAPVVCREFDCRLMYLKFDRPSRRRLERRGLMTKEVFAAGRARLHTLKEPVA